MEKNYLSTLGNVFGPFFLKIPIGFAGNKKGLSLAEEAFIPDTG